jgi:competence protein ComEA
MELNEVKLSKEKQLSPKKLEKFNFDEFIFNYRWPLTLLLIGAILVGFGVFFAKDSNLSETKVEVLKSATEVESVNSTVVVEVVGAVEAPGVYQLENGARVDDALIAAKGLSADADRDWMEKFLNRASKVSDGQKIYIPREGEEIKGAVSDEALAKSEIVGSGLININTASQIVLEGLPGIGPVYAQNIIEQRPYSTVEELVSKGALKQGVYEKIKDEVSVY